MLTKEEYKQILHRINLDYIRMVNDTRYVPMKSLIHVLSDFIEKECDHVFQVKGKTINDVLHSDKAICKKCGYEP